MTISHDDLNRSLGRLEGNQEAMGDRLDRFEEVVTKGLAELREDIADLKHAAAERKGERNVTVWLVSFATGIVMVLLHWAIRSFGGES